MLRPRLRKIAASVLMLGLSIPIMGGVNQNESGAFNQRILWSHNRERATKGIAPLTWDNQLRDAAQSWANHLASTGTLDHSNDDFSEPTGENLWAGTQGYYTPEAMVNGWIDEKRVFKQGLFPDNSVTGDVSDVGHYTQVMWRDTIEVGCGKAVGHGQEILVCRYKSAGNYEGERPF